MVRFLVNVPDELHMILKENAKAQGQTLNGLMRQILWNWAERNSRDQKGAINIQRADEYSCQS